MKTFQTLIESARDTLDMAEPQDQKRLYDIAGAIGRLDAPERAQLQQVVLAGHAPLELRIADLLARSRDIVMRIDHPVQIGVVFAMWGEQNRLRPRTEKNPNGEDALRVKLEQLAWVCKGSKVQWTVYAVDDGCPHGSGEMAAGIAANSEHCAHVRVLMLAHAMPARSGPLMGLMNINHSHKGGAIILGCQEAIADGVDAVVYTDADNSVHLGQLGLLLDQYVNNKARIVLGNRKHPQAVLVKQEARWGVGIKLLRHMQRMIGKPVFSQGIHDTQAAFKLYQSQLLRRILEKRTVFDFSFDTDWLLAATSMGEPLTNVPFAFIDSAAESASLTQGPMSTWATLLKGLAIQARAHRVPHSAEMCQLLDDEIHSAADLDLLIHQVPPQLANADDQQLGDPALMSPQEIRQWIAGCRRKVAVA